MDIKLIPSDVAKWRTIKLSENFTLHEALFSAKAEAKGMAGQNVPTQAEMDNITLTISFLQGIRKYLGMPMSISSLFRNATINKLVGGSSTSAHRYGLAADITCNGLTPRELAEKLAAMKDLPFDQIILEYPNASNGQKGQWVHIGFCNGGVPRKIPRRQILTAVKTKEGKTEYLAGFQKG